MGKRINIVCNYSSIYAGNFIPSILNLCEKLDSDVIVFSFPIEAQNRKWVYFIKSQGYAVFFYRSNRFKKDISLINKNNDINLVYTHFISGLKIKMTIPFNRHIKLFIHVHSDFSGNKKPSLKQRIKKFIECKCIRTDSTYIFVSKPLFLKDKSKNKHYVCNALCLDRFFTSKVRSDNYLDTFHINKQDTIFLLFGWSPYIKGVDLAVKAFLDLPIDLQNKAKFIIVHGKDDGLKKCVDFLSEKLGNTSFLNNHNLIFLPPEEDVFSLYKMCDVYVMASRSEGFSYSLMESLYFNLRCIVSDIDGCAWAKQYDNCIFFKANDSQELSQIMKKCIGQKRNPTTNMEIAKKYDINIWSNEIKSILER